MNKSYVVYEKKTGRISKAVSCSPSVIEVQCTKDETYIEGAVTSDGFRVVDDVIQERPASPVYLEGDTLHRVGKGAKINIDGTEYVADGSPIQLTFSLPGVYKVTVTEWPYLDWETHIEN